MELDVRTHAKPAKPEPIRVSRSRKSEHESNGDSKNVPKPFPRNARSNSVEEDRPIARPRTTTTRPEPDQEGLSHRDEEECRPVFRRAKTYVQEEAQESSVPERPVLRRSNTDMNEESKMRADMLESEKESKDKSHNIIQSVNPNVPVSGGYKVLDFYVSRAVVSVLNVCSFQI